MGEGISVTAPQAEGYKSEKVSRYVCSSSDYVHEHAEEHPVMLRYEQRCPNILIAFSAFSFLYSEMCKMGIALESIGRSWIVVPGRSTNLKICVYWDAANTNGLGLENR